MKPVEIKTGEMPSVGLADLFAPPPRIVLPVTVRLIRAAGSQVKKGKQTVSIEAETVVPLSSTGAWWQLLEVKVE